MGTHIDIDPVARTITLITPPVDGLVTLGVARDIYSEAKEDWLANSELRKMRFPLRDPITFIIRGVQAGPFVFVDNENGWRIVPYDANHELALEGDMFPLSDSLPLFTPRTGRTITIFGYLSAKTQTALIESGTGSWNETEKAQIRYQLGVDGDTTPTTEQSELAEAVWDVILTAAKHNLPTSAGRRLRDVSGKVVTTGIAQGNGNGANQIELNGDASTQDGAYDPAAIAIVNGTGYGQTRLIFEYDGSTRIATVDRNWKTQPDVTSEYVIYANPGREHVNEGLAQGGSSNTIQLNTLASTFDDAYCGQTVFIRSGTGEDQARTVVSYDGTTKIATIHCDWDVIPDTTSGYVMIPSQDRIIEISRLLGLNLENSFIDETKFEDVNNPNSMTGGRRRIFDSKENSELAQDGDSYNTGLIATYTIEAEYETGGKLKSYREVLEP